MSVELLDSMGSDDSIVNAARVSFSKEASNFTEEQNQKLLLYLAKHRHWSPFAHAFLSFRIKVPMFVAMQLDKHTVGLVTNSISRRYVDHDVEFWFPNVWRGRPTNGMKQGSTGVIDDRCPSDSVDVINTLLEHYNFLLESGVAPEQARMVLPMNLMTERIWSGSLYAFARVCNLRLDKNAQVETQQLAQMINNSIPSEFEHSWKALVKHE